MKKVILTGGTGFIGRHVLENLIKLGYEIYVISRKEPTNEFLSFLNFKNVKHYKIDILEINNIESFISRIKPTHLIHLAWDTKHPDNLKSMDNFLFVLASMHLFKNFIKYGGKRAVVSGTYLEYNLDYGYLIEDITPCSYDTQYTACKNALYILLKSISQVTALSFCWARIFNVYGPYDFNNRRLIPYLITQLINSKEAVLNSGDSYRDFIYVSDVASALTCLLEGEVEGIVNIGSGIPVKISEVALKIGEKLNKLDFLKFNTSFTKENNTFSVSDNRRLKSLTTWQQEYDLNTGLELTISWWKKVLKFA